jgi:hypothetical protein
MKKKKIPLSIRVTFPPKKSGDKSAILMGYKVRHFQPEKFLLKGETKNFFFF